MRIVSLLASATEIVAALGLKDQLVGISHCCDWPDGIDDLPVLTDSVVDSLESSADIDATVREALESSAALYQLDRDTLATLNPDLVLSQALCDVCAVSGDVVLDGIDAIPGGATLVNLEPFTLDDVLATILEIGKAAGVAERALTFVEGLYDRITAVRVRSAAIAEADKPRVMVIDWVDPPFISGHWMHDLIDLAGGLSLLDAPGSPSRTTSWAEISAAKPDFLLVANCGFTASRSMQELRSDSGGEAGCAIRALMDTGCRVAVTDGNFLFSRPGPRLVESLELLAHLLHPGIHPPSTSAILPADIGGLIHREDLDNA